MPDRKNSKVVAGSSIGFGTILAIVLSWTANKSIIWAIIHGLFNWLYVIYYLITRDDWTWF
jgi:hypothetical protein